MKIYLVIQTGIYRHDVFGAYLTLEQAHEAAQRAMKKEKDSHHHFEVLQMTTGVDESEGLIGAWSQVADYDFAAKPKGPPKWEPVKK